MLESVRIATRHFRKNRFAGVLVAGAASLLLGACAHNVAGTPELQWQVNTVEATDAAPAYGAAGASSSTGCDDCYVYRGGRDPHTGLAYTQL